MDNSLVLRTGLLANVPSLYFRDYSPRETPGLWRSSDVRACLKIMGLVGYVGVGKHTKLRSQRVCAAPFYTLTWRQSPRGVHLNVLRLILQSSVNDNL